MKNKYTPQEIEDALKKGGIERRRCFLYLTEERYLNSLFKSFNSFKNSSKEDIKSAYHESIMILGRNITEGKIKNIIKIDGFFQTTFKNEILKLLRKSTVGASNNTIAVENLSNIIRDSSDLEKAILNKELLSIVILKINQIGGVCKKLLTARILHEVEGKELAILGNYNDVNTAYASLSRCLNKLRSVLQ